MKNHFILIVLVLFSLLFKSGAQTFSPISTFGYNIDAVAENTTALATTGGAIDGSNFALYSTKLLPSIAQRVVQLMEVILCYIAPLMPSFTAQPVVYQTMD